MLYSVTTISGPPLAIMLNNQGLAKRDFRAALGLVRLAESSMTAAAYPYAGLFTATSLALIPWILPTSSSACRSAPSSFSASVERSGASA